MITLDFSKGSLYAHEQLIEIITLKYAAHTKNWVKNVEYEEKRNGKIETLGELDIAVTKDNTLQLIEVKTNSDVAYAAKELQNHYKNIQIVLRRLPLKLCATVTKIKYLAIIYELYLVFEIDPQTGKTWQICTIDAFLKNPFNSEMFK